MAILKKKKKSTETKPTFNKTEYENHQLELYRLKQQKSLIEKREKELKQRLDEYMTNVLTPDSKGHYTFTVVDENGNRIHLQKQARKSISLNEERAAEYLEEHGLTQAIVEKDVIAEEVTEEQIIEVLMRHAPHFLDKKNVVDESSLEQLVQEGTIPMEDFEKLCDIKITYAMTFIDDKKMQQGEVDNNATKGNRKGV